jgi:two-component system, NtrC family, sensor kinase
MAAKRMRPTASREEHLSLELADRTSSLSALAGGMAHEINNPLGFVLGNLQVAEEYFNILANRISLEPKGSESEAQNRDADELDFVKRDSIRLCRESIEGLKRVERLVAAVLEFAKVDEVKAAATDVSAVLEGALAVLQPRIRYSMDLDLRIESRPTIKGFPQRLKHAFVCLIENAIEASYSRGLLRVTQRSDAGRVIIEIADDGSGIPADALARVFHPFFTTRLNSKPTQFGLGLPIALRILEAHSGYLFICSEAGVGTKVRVILPEIDPGTVVGGIL